MSEADGDLQASPAPAAPLVLFDGVCNFCDAAVDFILARARSGRFRFASLQGSTARGLAERIGPLPATPNSIVLVTGAIIYTESSAALRILAGLGGCWCLALGLLVVPAAIRDRVYRWFARNRYRWFGKRDTCRVPEPHERARLLD